MLTARPMVAKQAGECLWRRHTARPPPDSRLTPCCACCCPTFYRCPPPAPPAPDRETRCSLFLGTTLWHSSCHTRKIIAKLPPFTNCSISVPSPFAGSLLNAQPFHLSPSAVITPKHHPAPPAPLGALLAAGYQSFLNSWRLLSQLLHCWFRDCAQSVSYSVPQEFHAQLSVQSIRGHSVSL